MIKRTSPINMGLEPESVLKRNGWEIPLAYVGERVRNNLFVTDLSHIPKWSLQGENLDEMRPAGVATPPKQGAVAMSGGTLLARLTPSEARIFSFSDELPLFEEFNYTDMTDAYAALAVVGPRCFDVLSKLSAVDLEGAASPQAALAPIEDITCFMVRLEGSNGAPGLILASARGYGHFLLDAVMDAGKEYGIQPSGWRRFSAWLG